MTGDQQLDEWIGDMGSIHRDYQLLEFQMGVEVVNVAPAGTDLDVVAEEGHHAILSLFKRRASDTLGLSGVTFDGPGDIDVLVNLTAPAYASHAHAVRDVVTLHDAYLEPIFKLTNEGLKRKFDVGQNTARIIYSGMIILALFCIPAIYLVGFYGIVRDIDAESRRIWSVLQILPPDILLKGLSEWQKAKSTFKQA